MLTPNQQAAFDADGWLVLRGVIDRPRVAELIRALDAVVPEHYYVGGYEGRVVEVAGISRGSADILSNAHDPRLARVAADALGTRRLRLFQDTAFIKPAAGAARVEWHQDYAYFAYLDRPAAVTVRVALTPCTRENGCLRVISGSHAWGLQGGDLSFRATTVEDAFEALPSDLRALARDHEAVLELEPGDVSLHHCLTFHSSAENRARTPRKTLAVRFVDADVRLDRSRLASPELAAHLPADVDGRLSDEAFSIVYDADA